MKRTVLNLTLAAAAVLATVTTASAQNLKAEIPFPFEANGARMQPGSYSVSLSLTGASKMVQIYNVDAHRSALAVPQAVAAPAWWQPSTAVLSFACTNGRCILSSLRDEGSNVYSFPAGKKTAETRIATVILKNDRTE